MVDGGPRLFAGIAESSMYGTSGPTADESGGAVGIDGTSRSSVAVFSVATGGAPFAAGFEPAAAKSTRKRRERRTTLEA